jgi:hypothetical protein
MLAIYSEGLLALNPTTKLEDQPLLDVNLSFSIFTVALDIWRLFPPSVT